MGKITGLLILALGVFAVTIQSGHAEALNNETVQSVIGEMTNINTQMKSLLSENDGLVTANENLVKRNALWEEQLTGRIQPLIDVHLEKSRAHVATEERLTKEINRHNSGCSGTVSQPVYDKCTSEASVLKRLSANYYAEKEVLVKERASLDKEYHSYVKLINDNNVKVKANFERHLVIKAAVEQYTETLEYYRSRLIDLCAEADTDRDGEALHHCHSMSWDGTKKNLPILDEILRGTQFFN